MNLKQRPPYPFETIATAVAFSERLESILYETKRLVELYNAMLVLIHVGKRTDKKEELLDQLVEKTQLSKNKHRVIWMEGEPVETILRLCKLNVVDLLIIGALEKESIFKQYVGSVARNISRKAKCSVLLLTHPSISPKRIKRMIVNWVENPKTVHSFKTSLYIAEKENIKEFYVVHEVNLPSTLNTKENITLSESITGKPEKYNAIKIKSAIENIDTKGILVHIKVINGKPGYAISQYAKSIYADLLVVNSPDQHLGLLDRIFTHDIEYVLADLPCNLLIVHSRV